MKIVLRGGIVKITRNRSVFLGKVTMSTLFFLVFVFREEGGGVRRMHLNTLPMGFDVLLVLSL